MRFWQLLKIFCIGKSIDNLLELSLISKISQILGIEHEYEQCDGDALTQAFPPAARLRSDTLSVRPSNCPPCTRRVECGRFSSPVALAPLRSVLLADR